MYLLAILLPKYYDYILCYRHILPYISKYSDTGRHMCAVRKREILSPRANIVYLNSRRHSQAQISRKKNFSVKTIFTNYLISIFLNDFYVKILLSLK